MKWRGHVEKISPYVPGKSIEAVKKEYNVTEVHRLASNENPLGPSEKAKQAMAEAAVQAHLYPDTSALSLRERLADLYGVTADEILTGNGADNVISLVVSAYVNEGDEVVYGTPTFPAYRSSTLLMGGVPVEVPLTEDFTYDLEAIQASITPKTKLVFICNPNNPTGTIVDKEALEKFIQEVPSHVLVILDEAYIEYVTDEAYKTGIDFYKEGYPVLTIRTFSKFYSLAGLRIGYALGSKEVLDPILRLREPFALNRIAIAAAVASVGDVAFARRHLKMNADEKEYMTSELEKLGFTVYPSKTNFLFVDIKRNGIELFEQLMKRGIIIRPCAAWGLDEYVRISIGLREQNEKLIEALNEIVAS